MKFSKLIYFFILCIHCNVFAQNLEIEGGVKFSSIPNDSVAESVLVLDSDGYLAQSDKFVSVQPQIGQFYEGGVVFYTFNGGENGLIVSLYDVGDSIAWAPTFDTIANVSNRLKGDSNTVAIVDFYGPGNYAAYLCDTFTGGGYVDWYLPSIGELTNLYTNIYAVNWALENDNNASSAPMSTTSKYLSSTELSFGSAMGRSMLSPFFGVNKLSVTDLKFRAIRKY